MTREDANCFTICAAEAGLAAEDRYYQQAVESMTVAAINESPTLRVGYKSGGVASCCTLPVRWDANGLLRSRFQGASEESGLPVLGFRWRSRKWIAVGYRVLLISLYHATNGIDTHSPTRYRERNIHIVQIKKRIEYETSLFNVASRVHHWCGVQRRTKR